MGNISSFNIKTIEEEFFSILKNTGSRSESLKTIAGKATEYFGEYITPGNLNLACEIEISFTELIDQIIYEFRENTEYEANIRDYIIDDLYSRLSLYLESINDIKLYTRNIKNRPLTEDDLIIIKKRNLTELIPLLTAEYEEITLLQKPIIKTLLYFENRALAEFFLNSYKSASNGFIKSASLLGLRYSEKPMDDTILCSNDEKNSLVSYAEKFSLNEISENPLPPDMEEATFALLHIEKTIKNYRDSESVKWVLNLLNTIPALNFENSWLNEINISLGNIMLTIDLDLVKEYLSDENNLITTISFIDLLPRNIFNRITGRLDDLGIEFHYKLNSMLDRKELKICELNSNIFSYLTWNAR